MASKYASLQRRWFLLTIAGVALLPGTLARALSAVAESKTNLKSVEIPVEGMACVACAASIRRALKSLDGVSRVEVSLEKRSARVTYAPAQISPAAMVEAINKLGYKAGTPKEV